MKKVVFPLFLLFLFSLTIAQPPQKMSYQSVVRDAHNSLIVNQTIGVKITIRQHSLQGPAVLCRNTHYHY